MRFFSRYRFDGFLIILGAAAIFCMVGAPLAMVAAITIIGLPITFAMAIIPPLFFFLLTVRVLRFAIPVRGGWVLSAIAAAALFAITPSTINAGLDHSARLLASADRNKLQSPFAGRSLAVLASARTGRRDESRCDDFCMRALLSGALDAVLVSDTEDFAAPPGMHAPAISFRMERRTSCPIVHFRPGVGKLDIDDKSPDGRKVDAAELMRLQIAGGNCLIEASARLGDADAVMAVGRIKRGMTPYAAGLDLFADTVSADRISVWTPAGDQFEEQYRWTGVEFHPLLPFLLPSYVTGYGFDVRTGFLRRLERLNIDEKYYEHPNRTAFLTRTLGLNLALDSSRLDEMRTAALNISLEHPGDLDEVTSELANDFFDTLRDRRSVTSNDAEQALRILADTRIPVSQSVWVLAKFAATLPQDVQRRTGDLYFWRLGQMAPARPGSQGSWDEQASALASGIRHLPAPAILPHRANLEALARSEDLRVPAWQSLIRLSDFGTDAVPTLLYLMEDSERFRKKGGNDWQHPYLAGLIGLCMTGVDAGNAVAPLLARIDAGLAPMHASYGDLMLNTLVTIGADPEAVRDRFLPTAGKDDRGWLDRKLRRARERPDCTY